MLYILGFYTSRALEDANHLITNSKSRTRLAKFLENQIFSLWKFRGPKWFKLFAVPGGPGRYQGPGPEASASPASWMTQPCTNSTICGLVLRISSKKYYSPTRVSIFTAIQPAFTRLFATVCDSQHVVVCQVLRVSCEDMEQNVKAKITMTC